MSMPIPADLQEAIGRGYAALLRDRQYALPPRYRQDIYAALGPMLSELRLGGIDPTTDLEAYRARLTLSQLTVRRVLPIWQRLYPDYPWPQKLVDLAEDVLLGRVGSEPARIEAENAANILELDGYSYPGG